MHMYLVIKIIIVGEEDIFLLHEFWKRYKIMESKLRHHSEVIQEGFPCHLYFDLEFNKRDNLGRDGVDLLISVILEALLEKYSINGNQDWMVELDSYTGEKFSHHLIMRIPKTAFKNNSPVDDDGLLTSNNLEYQFVNNAKGRVLLYSNLDLDYCSNDSWWLEAIKVADNLESKPEISMLKDSFKYLHQLFKAVSSQKQKKT